MRTTEDMSETWRFYETPIRESLKAWWFNAADTPPTKGVRVPARLLLPAIGLGALAALSIYHRLATAGVGTALVPDKIDARDPLQHHNVVLQRPDLGHYCIRMVSILFAIQNARGNPQQMHALSSELKVPASQDSSALCVEALSQIFEGLPTTDAMGPDDYSLLQARINHLGTTLNRALDQYNNLNLN